MSACLSATSLIYLLFGLLLDRFGPRRVLLALLGLAVARGRPSLDILRRHQDTRALFARTAATPVPLNRATFAIEREYMALDYVRRQYPGAQVMTVDNTGDALRAERHGQFRFSRRAVTRPGSGRAGSIANASPLSGRSRRRSSGDRKSVV